MKKTLLMTPGPSQVPPQVLQAMAEPIFYHRTAEYRELQSEVAERLKRIFFSSGDVVVLAASGTGAMEASVVNVLGEGRKGLSLEGGKFGQRWGQICEAFGYECERVEIEWGKAAKAAAVAERLAADKSIAAVYATLVETSTGVENDIRAIGEAVAGTDAILVVDGISGAGGSELRFDDWGVDILVVGSQKALMMPPGLAVAVVSEKARKLIETANRKAYYFDLKKALGKAADSDTPFTPANTLVRALATSLRMMEDEGMEAVFARHRMLAEAMRAGAQALGMKVFAERPAAVVTAIELPESIDGAALPKLLEKKFGVKVAGGQEHLKGRILRVAHMGYCSVSDVIVALSALEMALAELGAKVELGAAVKAAEAVFASR